MSKFKIGDRVRTAWGKEVATIVSVHVSGKLFGVSYNGNSPQNYHEDWLTLVDEQKQPMGFDDSEPWDGEWLNSIGFAGEGKDGWAIVLPNGVKLNIGHDYGACLTDRDRKLYLTSRIYLTKGDVRLLCAALGAELKGGG